MGWEDGRGIPAFETEIMDREKSSLILMSV